MLRVSSAADHYALSKDYTEEWIRVSEDFFSNGMKRNSVPQKSTLRSLPTRQGLHSGSTSSTSFSAGVIPSLPMHPCISRQRCSHSFRRRAHEQPRPSHSPCLLNTPLHESCFAPCTCLGQSREGSVRLLPAAIDKDQVIEKIFPRDIQETMKLAANRTVRGQHTKGRNVEQIVDVHAPRALA